MNEIDIATSKSTATNTSPNPNTLACIEEKLGPQRDSLYIVIPIIVIYVVIFITGFIGNISTCIVIARNKSMHTATNYYLFSLAISDLLLLTWGLPQEIYLIWSRYPYIFGGTFCFLHGLFAETSANATVCTITAFTVERYLAICYPLRSRTMSKLSRAIKIIFAIWFFSFCAALPQALQFRMIRNGDCEMCYFAGPIVEHSFEISTFVFFVAPMSLITLLYVLIGVKLKASRMLTKRRNDCVRRKSSRNIIKMLVAVVVAFFICWAPFHAQRLFSKYSTELLNDKTHSLYLKVYEIVTYTSGVLYYISATINPILYNIMSVKFREAFKETFKAICCVPCCFRPSMFERAYSVISRSNPTGVARDSTTTDSTNGGKNEAAQNARNRNGNFSLDHVQRLGDEQNVNEAVNVENNVIEIYIHVEENNEQKCYCCNFLSCLHNNHNGKKKMMRKSISFSAKHSVRDDVTALGDPRRANSDKNSLSSYQISNSSLKEMEHEALEDELTNYMKKFNTTSEISSV